MTVFVWTNILGNGPRISQKKGPPIQTYLNMQSHYLQSIYLCRRPNSGVAAAGGKCWVLGYMKFYKLCPYLKDLLELYPQPHPNDLGPKDLWFLMEHDGAWQFWLFMAWGNPLKIVHPGWLLAAYVTWQRPKEEKLGRILGLGTELQPWYIEAPKKILHTLKIFDVLLSQNRLTPSSAYWCILQETSKNHRRAFYVK